MPTLFEKMNLKDQTEIVVLNAPSSFEAELASLKHVTIRRSLTKAGKVLIHGAYVSNRSSGVMRIKGGSVQIN